MHDKKEPVKTSANNFFDCLDEWINRRRNQVSQDSWKDYKSLRKHLLSFQAFRKKKIRFELIDYAFYEDLLSFLHYEVLKPNGEFGLAPNTVGKQIKNLKLFLRNSIRRKLCPTIDLDGFKVIQIDTDNVYLTEDELDQIEALDLSKDAKLDQVRDLFLVGCETGLRFSDFTNLNRNCIQEKVIRLTTKKTLRKVVIPISQRLKKIIKKYNGDFPPSTYKNNFNKTVKTVIRLAKITNEVQILRVHGNKKVQEWIPKYKLVASHTCRRTFCTNAFLKGIPTILIRSASGHSSDKMLFKYIKIDNIDAAENALKFIEF